MLAILDLLPLHTNFTISLLKAKVAQSWPTLCDPMNYAVHEILQARILEWVAFPFSRVSSHPGIEHGSLELQADSLPTELSGKTLVC